MFLSVDLYPKSFRIKLSSIFTVISHGGQKVKRIFAKDTCLLFLCLAMTSCSSLWSHRQSASGTSNDIKEENQEAKFVSKEQYDELARKYQELLNTTKEKVDNKVVKAEANPVAAEPTKDGMRPEVATTTTLDPGDIVNKIDQAVPDAKPEGVELNSDAKPSIAKQGPPIPETMGVQHVNLTDDVDDQIVKLREATDLIKVNKFENALVILKELENSKEKQVVVRAKIMLGDLLFSEGEYDLAMQVYEEVIKKYAFSGYVLKALGKLVACSEKLKQPEKQAKYYSLLHDFFEAV
jgi:TolA-binding protein